jgi:hypothetical protein
MSFNRPDIENITEADIQELKDNAVGEGILYDYKLDLYGRSDADKKEFLKDASSFANTAGGHILIGVKEDQGLPIDIPGIATDLDEEMRRLESLLRDRIEPRILGIRMQPVGLTNARYVLVVRIPRSWNSPHAVLQNKSRLIFVRNSAGVHEASVDEMRTMFNAGADLFHQAREFQDKRLDVVHIDTGPFSNLRGCGRIVLHIIPFSAFRSPNPIELKRLDPSHLVPPWCSGCEFGFNVDGYWTKSGSDNRAGYLQVFRNGIVETAAADIRTALPNADLYILAENFEDKIAEKVNDCLLSLQRADVPLPAYVMLAGTRMRGTYVIKGLPAPIEVKALPLRNRFELPPTIIEDYSTIDDYRQALKPLFDAVWNAAGYESSQSYDQDGKWKR